MKFFKRLFGIEARELNTTIDFWKKAANEDDLLLKKIEKECRFYMQQNRCVSYAGFQKILDLATTDQSDC